ncbi:metallophosphoesterase family protein [Pantanalinema sp. GBBB05]|uniref:metallophosphoesterase family protein n=1 Tax=Pantanalinema sp. GBBB05 TaxID=2604139 RepID=UPI001E0C8605|nr:metallophosphoesterase [Pantanalinema sp. GBBB05]
MSAQPRLLTDPFLQLPSETSVWVVWFTEFAGIEHRVVYGAELQRNVTATSRVLTRVREDHDSQLDEQYEPPTQRLIWRHEAEVNGLVANTRIPYQVMSVREDGAIAVSPIFTLSPQPLPGQPLQILLTSDHQLKPMVAANLQKVVETVGQVDAVFLAGDLVNVPDRASEWFDDRRGNAFFPVLQGRAHYKITTEETTTDYQGGAIIQSAPLYTAIGNHEVMGRFRMDTSLREQFADAVPRAVAEAAYRHQADVINPQHDPLLRDAWIKQQSFNTDTYEEIFTLPDNPSGGKRYYAVTFGDLRLVVLYATTIWRSPSLDANIRGRYRERAQDFNNPDRWGYGHHLFEAIAPGSPQYQWLERELGSPEFQQAKYKVVMLHHPPHSLGTNSVPAYTDPVPVIERDPSGAIAMIRYEYPKTADYLIRDVMPLLEAAGTQLVFYGHSHIWNRFVSPGGMHFLETSNVGNSYGAHVGNHPRPVPPRNSDDYVQFGNPNGLAPIVPTIAPLINATGQPLPYIASNDITVFSILDTRRRTVSSYRFDTRTPDANVVKFDEFALK